MQTYSDLKNKVVVITGASSGIGSAAARLIGGCGAKVVVNYWSNEKGASETGKAVEAAGGKALVCRADVSRAEGCAALLKQTEAAFGPIDVLINNAGTLVARQRLLELTEETWDKVMDINLKSVFFCCQGAARSMIERKRGVMVNMASIAARNGGGPGAGHYAAAKAAVIALSKNLARELAPHGIRINCVAPGIIDTPYHERFSSPEMIKSFVAGIPMGRVGASAEVASVIAFLASDASSYVCGETIEINGAQLML